MKVAHYKFTCAIIDGLFYTAGWNGTCNKNMSSVEVFDPTTKNWILIELFSLRFAGLQASYHI